MTTAEFVLFLNGSYGTGKTATLDHVGDLLAERGTPFALMDVDWFHRSWPSAASDDRNVAVEAQNMAAVWANYRATGPRQLVVAGVIESVEDRTRYSTAFGMPVRSVRLTADAATVESRLRRRHLPDRQRALDWHLERHAALAASLERSDVDELVIPTSDRTPREIAETVLAHVGL